MRGVDPAMRPNDAEYPSYSNLLKAYRLRGVMIERLSKENARLRLQTGALRVGPLEVEAE